MKKRILIALAGVAMIVGSIALIPYCDGDGGYLFFTMPLGLLAIFGQKHLDID